jgi:hypothetical protein
MSECRHDCTSECACVAVCVKVCMSAHVHVCVARNLYALPRYMYVSSYVHARMHVCLPDLDLHVVHLCGAMIMMFELLLFSGVCVCVCVCVRVCV